MIRRARRTYSRSIVKRLRTTGRTLVLDVSDRRGTWNPAKKEVSGRLFANGQAEYTLDASGVVHLRFRPRSGGEARFEGPIPQWHDSPAGRQCRRFRPVFYALYWGLLADRICCRLSALQRLQNPEARHRLRGAPGRDAGYSLASIFLRVAISVRTLIRDRNR